MVDENQNGQQDSGECHQKIDGQIEFHSCNEMLVECSTSVLSMPDGSLLNGIKLDEKLDKISPDKLIVLVFN